MPGIVSQFVLLDLVVKRMQASSDPAQAAIAQALTSEPAYANLGAVGPDLFDFMPNDLTPGKLGTASLPAQFWQIIYGVANGLGSGAGAVPGLVATLAKLNGFLSQLDSIASKQDLGALSDFKNNGSLDQALAAMKDLATIVGNISNVAGNIMANIKSQQPFGPTFALGSTVPPPIVWDCRDFVFWKRTGQFASALIANARQANDPRYLAYAYGYAIAYTGKVCGSPFLNSILNSVYRLNWWRHRWLNLFGDAWVWGFYNMPTRPTQPYDYLSWPSLCEANLQQRIELPGIDPATLLDVVTSGQAFPSVLPADFASFWFDTFAQVYGAPPAGSRFSADALNGAYLLTYLMLWFQTSGKALGCNAAPPMAPPDSKCGDNPPWVDPTQVPPGSGGTPNLPPAPTVEHHADVGEIVCGAIVALLGLAGLFTGNLVAGGGALGAGIDLILQGASQIDWDKLRCQLYWYHLYLYNGLNALHQAAMLVGIVHPYASELATDSTTLNLLNLNFTFDSGERIVRSRGHARDFPAGLWVPGVLPDWIKDPTAAAETPTTVPYLSVAYPDFWLDDAINNPLSNGQVRVGGPWPVEVASGSDFPVQFGNALDNAIDVLTNPQNLPDWNLDADRGLAYLTWQFDGPYTNPVKIEPES